MPHHFKWINRATLLFNLASAELVGGWVGVRGVCVCVCAWKGCDQRCTDLSVFVVDGQADGQTYGRPGRLMEGQTDQMIGRVGTEEDKQSET